MTPAGVVEAQLNAYNAKDIDAFMQCWADDARFYAHPDTLLCEGHAAIRARHVERFDEPDLHARLIDRQAIGETVIDRERVTRTFPQGRGEIDVVAIYEVKDGKIARAWFISGQPEFQNRR
ncbi:nuclear transport factor 2 family protein [Asticcacaulis solisilvae]|uniref:nuclear transport factor 2 family protein n=1 Tax=Asticcacaulis solisilvae TaxID=1217274 RepID=UPI003FD89696